VLAHISKPDLFARPIVITKSDFRFVVAEQLRERGIAADIVLEPIGGDSGPAVAVAAELAAKRDRDALVLMLAADHVVHRPDAFRDACRRTVAAAAAGWIAAFGVEPTRPVSGYGYIRPGERLNGASVRAIEAYVEKPDAGTAAQYLADGYLWSSGDFLCRPRPCSARSNDLSRRWPLRPRRRWPA
jgi:mannose-1-phosphate guanylyltransferase